MEAFTSVIETSIRHGSYGNIQVPGEKCLPSTIRMPRHEDTSQPYSEHTQQGTTQRIYVWTVLLQSIPGTTAEHKTLPQLRGKHASHLLYVFHCKRLRHLTPFLRAYPTNDDPENVLTVLLQPIPGTTAVHNSLPQLQLSCTRRISIRVQREFSSYCLLCSVLSTSHACSSPLFTTVLLTTYLVAVQ